MITLLNINDLKPHERINEKHLEELIEEIRKDGVLKKPIVVDFKTKVILDGHHRVEALKRLGCNLIPAALVDYFNESIVLDTWKDLNGKKPSKKDVIRNALQGLLFPPKTTKHMVMVDGKILHISEIVGEVNFPLYKLLWQKRASVFSVNAL